MPVDRAVSRIVIIKDDSCHINVIGNSSCFDIQGNGSLELKI